MLVALKVKYCCVLGLICDLPELTDVLLDGHYDLCELTDALLDGHGNLLELSDVQHDLFELNHTQ